MVQKIINYEIIYFNKGNSNSNHQVTKQNVQKHVDTTYAAAVKENTNESTRLERHSLNNKEGSHKIPCDLCKQRIQKRHLNTLKECHHNYCQGCMIELRNNKLECLLADQHERLANKSEINIENDERTKETDAHSESTVTLKEASNNCEICYDDSAEIVYLYKCRHSMCLTCHKRMFSITPKCPFCFLFYGTPKGDQPKNGRMSHTQLDTSLPGYPNAKTIVIQYSIPSGKQEAHHPDPGRYYAGLNRTAYLPDNEEGRRILDLLYKAFSNGLTFTIGSSRTTGVDGVITWNDIHHKTFFSGSP